MYLRQDFSYLLIILIVFFIPHTTSHSCKQEESFWQGLPGRVWGGSSPRSKNDPSQICQAFIYLENHYEALCPYHNGKTGLEYWLGAFGDNSAQEGITIRNGLCQISGQMLSFSIKIADSLLYVCTSIQDMGFPYVPRFDDDDHDDVDLAGNWKKMVAQVYDQIVSANWKGIAGCKGEDLGNLVKKMCDVFWKILTILHLRKDFIPSKVDSDDITAMEDTNGKSDRFPMYIVGVCTVLTSALMCPAAACFRRHRRNAPGKVVHPLKAMTLRKFTRSTMAYSVADDYVECLRTHATPNARARFLKKRRAMRALKDVGAANQPNLIYLKETFSARYKLHMVMPNMRHGELLDILEYYPDRLDFDSRISVFKQIFPAVQWLHKVECAHLNIHPGAIFISGANFQVKLGKFTEAVKTNKRASNYHLHPNCCGPEVLRRRPYRAKHADFWALGALLFSLFSDLAVLPFPGFKPMPTHLDPSLVGFHSPAHSDKLIRVMFNLLYGRTMHRPINIELVNAAVNEY